MTSQLGTETVFAVSVIAPIALFGWFRATRLTSPIRWRGLWWTVLPIVMMVVLLILVVALGFDAPEGAVPGTPAIIALLATIALVGLFEELLFRGILFQGSEKVSGPITALVLSSVALGLMHHVNWVEGPPLDDTTVQVFHAMTGGFLYGALMLMTGSIWPGVILHAVWDGMVSMISTLTAAVPPALNIEPDSVDAAATLSAAGAVTGGGGAKSPPSCSTDTNPCTVSSCWWLG